MKKTERVVRIAEPEEDGGEEADEDDTEECTMMDQISCFDAVTVWGHECVPDDLENPYCKGIEELIAFAGAVCPCMPFLVDP